MTRLSSIASSTVYIYIRLMLVLCLIPLGNKNENQDQGWPSIYSFCDFRASGKFKLLQPPFGKMEDVVLFSLKEPIESVLLYLLCLFIRTVGSVRKESIEEIVLWLFQDKLF